MTKKNGEEYQRKPEEERAESEKREAPQTKEVVEGSQLPQSSTNQASLRSAIKDSIDGPKELPQTEKSRMPIPKELTPLVTDYLRSSNVSKDGNPATETVLDIWDFAGQHLYYVTHPIFFSPRAVYLLVHNMTKDLNALAEPSFKHGEEVVKLENLSNETNLDMLMSWLVSVHSIRQPVVNRSFVEAFKKKPGIRCLPPPVLVVGTHADKVSPVEMNEANDKIKESLKGKTYQTYHVLHFYNVDNSKSSDSIDIKAIKAKVQQILSSGLNANLPVKWFNFEKEVKTLAATKFHLTLDEIRVLAREKCFIEDDEQLDALLDYYHDLGVIVRFKDTVIIDTHWLINVFKKLITICPFHEQEVDRHLWEELQSTGVLDMQLINRMFESDDERFKGKTLKQDVLDMMEKYGFLAKFQEHSDSLRSDSSDESENCQVKYFVPAQLRVSPKILWSLIPQDTDPCPLIFKFSGGFVPHGLFAQLISRLIGRSTEFECMKPPKLYCNGVRFFLGKRSEFDLVLLCSKRSIRLTWRSHCTASADACQVTENSLAIKVRILIDKELENLCRQWDWLGNVHYETCVTCLSCQQANVEHQRHESSSCSDLDHQHLLPVTNTEPSTLMTCPEQFGDGSRFVLKGLHKWYHCPTSEQMPAKHDRRLAKASDVNVLLLADDISKQKWKVIGRLLKMKDSKLDEIEANKPGDVYEQCYMMLTTWQGSQDSNATCHLLKEALDSQLIMRKDLVDKYCYADN